MQSLTTSSISVISLIVSGNNGFWKATIHKKRYGKTWNIIQIFIISDSRHCPSRNLSCKFRVPSEKIQFILSEITVSQLLQSSHPYPHTPPLSFHWLASQQCLSDEYHLILCYQTLTNIISTSTKHSLSKGCFNSLQKSTRSSCPIMLQKRKQQGHAVN